MWDRSADDVTTMTAIFSDTPSQDGGWATQCNDLLRRPPPAAGAAAGSAPMLAAATG